MNLVIVESPTKAKTISKFLGREYLVESSYGHLRDLPKSKLGIDVKHDFKPTYVIPKKAHGVVETLKKNVAKAEMVILATDEDREGEAIAWHLVQALELGKEKKYERIAFHEITKPAIKDALASPRDIDINLVDAQQARRVLDRLVGYELSPFLWRKIRYGLSAGRVQSVAMRLVVEREREIQNFKKEEYWTIEADFMKSGVKRKVPKPFRATLYFVDGKNLGKMDVASETEAQKIISGLKGADYAVYGVETREMTRVPAPPFTTSTLQQEAARRFGFSAKQTMVIAQKLYEEGFITYMRTDSLNLATSALAQARAVITERFGVNYALAAPRVYTNKSKGAQEAHEAVRPTDFGKTPDAIGLRDRGQTKLYDLIYKRTLASQMQAALLEETRATIGASTAASAFVKTSADEKAMADKRDGKYLFRARGVSVKFDGFMKIYTEKGDENGEEENTLPPLEIGEKLTLKELLPLQHFTEPPPRYTDATLIKALEADGIGRPSTYAPTLSTIQERGYVEKIEKKYHPTEIGTLVNDLLVEHFPEIVDIKFTAHVEEELDEIAEGKTKWVPVIREFYVPFKKNLEEKEKAVEKQVEISETPCPHCGKPMLIKFGRNGKFLACPDPESKVTLPMPEEAAKIRELEEKTKDECCPICGKPMTVRRGRFGFFLGCSDYPNCKGVMKIWNKTGFKCPNCKIGDIVEKKSRGRGRPFYACTRYPECTFIANKKPESEAELAALFEAWKAKGEEKKNDNEKKSKPRAAKSKVKSD